MNDPKELEKERDSLWFYYKDGADCEPWGLESFYKFDNHETLLLEKGFKAGWDARGRYEQKKDELEDETDQNRNNL